jgi:hypothetical protein
MCFTSGYCFSLIYTWLDIPCQNELHGMKEQFKTMQSQLQTLINALGNIKDQSQINQTAKILYKAGLLNSS